VTPPSALIISSRTSRGRAEIAVGRVRALLAEGWDAHIALDGALALEAARDVLSGADLTGRVHLSAAHLPPGAAARARMPLGVARALARNPKGVAGQLLGGVTPRASTVLGREVAAVLLALRPDVVFFDSVAAALPRLPAARVAGSAVAASVEETDLEPGSLDETLQVAAAATALQFPSEGVRARAHPLGSRPGDAVIEAWAADPAVAAAVGTQRYPGRDRSLAGRPLRVLTAAPLTWRNGHEWALQGLRAALDAGVDLRHRIAGEGDHAPAVWFARHGLGLDEVVEITGEDEMGEALRWADAYLDAAVTAGAGGRAAAAMMAALPVVATERTERPPGTDAGCLLVPSRDPAAIAAALGQLAGDPALMSRLGEAGHTAVAEARDRGGASRAFVSMCELAAAAGRPG
jgi:glycosyltransferase involved in cell wall biosynthesis